MEEMNDSVVDTLTLKEWSIVETKSGQGMGALGDPEAYRGGFLTALVWVVKKRQDPQFKWEDAENFTLADATAFLGLDGDDDPKEETAA